MAIRFEMASEDLWTNLVIFLPHDDICHEINDIYVLYVLSPRTSSVQCWNVAFSRDGEQKRGKCVFSTVSEGSWTYSDGVKLHLGSTRSRHLIKGTIKAAKSPQVSLVIIAR